MGRFFFVREAYDSFAKVGWAAPTFVTVQTPLALVMVGLPLGLASLALGLFESTAARTELILGMAGTSFVFLVAWAWTTRMVSRRMFAEASVCRCSLLSSTGSENGELPGVEYDKNGDFFVRGSSLSSAARAAEAEAADAAEVPGATEEERDPDYRCFGINYTPAIRNGMIIKLSFKVKASISAVAMLLNLARGLLIEFESDRDISFAILTAVVIGISGLLIFDGLVAAVFGGERSLSALVGIAVYRTICQSPVPFEPVDGKAHDLQETLMAAELSPWGVAIPFLHRFVYDMRTTSTWLLPLFANYIALMYTYGAIHCKGCAAAFFIGLAVQGGLLSKPKSSRRKDDVQVKAISYSIWGPHLLLEDKGEGPGKEGARCDEARQKEAKELVLGLGQDVDLEL